MKKCSTPETIEMSNPEAKATSPSQQRPAKAAIDFIRLFARSYHFEPRLASLGSMILN